MPESVGLIAGEGKLPIALARAIRARGHRVVCVQVAGSPGALRRWCHVHALVSPGEAERVLRTLADGGVRQLVLAGRVDKLRVLSGHLDPLAREILCRTPDRTDAGLWKALAGLLDRHGFEVLPQPHFLPDLLAPRGPIAGRAPTEREWADLRSGLELARTVAARGIGQAVAVRDGVVLAVEAAEGTDGMIRRLRVFGPEAVVVKASRPDQDPRFDLPAIGPRTIALLQRAGVTALGVEAGRTLLLERTSLVVRATRAGVALVGL
ncbi:MAG: UDP-2,3-diacylglucosamine diphosphatase LpxI [Armatimonadota bacterium]|nr:UDP-2,3-diacylglucosamine diphosphatase LpxI [Armatimonadota bacterium]MDR7444011.1 UDP-2,3-diacylglucosamine diphosphatase LpxI [Armatimonadota bacterium]MDR7570929.1 UDP-2,3-diacylglucosamine diphosphatase LpxI [Armatimonadota bacterium]MDR7615386.1 UDP-2,3-diacylglucosamine diphosphatase LpxI [Armatimonadota bacterium]